MIKVLAIDGGGIRGIIPAMFLAELESMLKVPLSKVFDVIAGTSTGGLIALGLTRPDDKDHKKPFYKAADLVKLYSEEGEKIFSNSLLHKITSLDGILDEKYEATGIESVLKKYFKNTKLSQALTDVIVPSYETVTREPFFFKSRHAKNPNKKEYDYKMWEVARATSAAPTYFEAFKLHNAITKVDYSLVDGGVFANNPAMCAYVEAKTVFNTDDVLVVSLGTGQMSKAMEYDKIKKWGLIGWARPILDVVFDGVSDTVDYQLKWLLKEKKYFRFQTSLEILGKDSIDDAHKANIDELILLSNKMIKEVKDNGKLEALCNLLLAK